MAKGRIRLSDGREVFFDDGNPETEIIPGVHIAPYGVEDEDIERLDNNYKYHPPRPDQIVRYPVIRHQAKELEILLRSLTPKSREQSIASTKLEEFVFWANAAIARNEKE